MLREFFAKLMNLSRRGGAERELMREIDAHLALLQEDFERRGMNSQEAALAARRAYGGVEQAKELHREARSFVGIEQFAQDLRHAFRSLARTPGFTILSIVVLALGIGVNTTLFSTYNAVALKPLPVADPDRVVRLERWFESHSLGNGQYAFSYPEYCYVRDRAGNVSSLVAAGWVVGAIGGPQGAVPKRTFGQLVSANYFDGLGIHPFLGRGFFANEDQTPGANAVIVISHRYWAKELSSDPRVLGQSIKLNGAAFIAIGIAPEEFTGTPDAPQEIDFWAPLSMQAQLISGQNWLTTPDQRFFQIFARLNDRAIRGSVQSQIDLLVRQFATTYTEIDKTTAVTLQRTTYFPNVDDIRFQATTAGVMLIVGLVLFVACANVGNMMLARGAARQREISTRLALGASRGRVIRLLLAESALLSCLGGAAAWILSIWTTKLLAITLQQNTMVLGGDFSAINLSPDLRVTVYVAAISLAAGILFGLSPALQITRRDMTSSLKEEGATFGGFGKSRLRSFLIASQVTVSILLLAIAGLLARGLVRSQAADPEFHTRDIYIAAADFSNTDPAKAAENQRRLMDRLRNRPEIASVTLGERPFGGTWTPLITVGNIHDRTLASYASENYFDTLGIPLLRGRNFPPNNANPHLAIISELTARRFFPNQDAIGKFITLDMDFRGSLQQFEVIGIVKDVRYANLTRIDPSHVYLPALSPAVASTLGKFIHRNLDTLVRIPGDPQQALMAMDAISAAERDRTTNFRLINLDDGAVKIQRMISQTFTMLAAILATLALTLAGVGIYGVVGYLVSQRTREIGVRMALGATTRGIVNHVVLRGLRPVMVGAAIGVVCAAALSALLHRTLLFPGSMDFLYGVPFYDPVTFASLIVFVIGIAALASTIPARRASRVDPALALRHE
jgi:predicted permease